VYPKVAPDGQPSKLTLSRNRIDDLYFTVRGIIINDNPTSIQVRPDGAVFTEGETYLAPGAIEVPRRFHPNDGDYFLAPGQVALFEWRASRTVIQWIQYYDDDEHRLLLPQVSFIIFLAGDLDIASYVEVELDCSPLEEISDNEWVIRPFGYTQVNIKAPKPWHPKSIEELGREVKQGESANL
jgi:hypothetical protein